MREALVEVAIETGKHEQAGENASDVKGGEKIDGEEVGKMAEGEIEGIDEGLILWVLGIVKAEEPSALGALFHFGKIGVVVVPAHDEA